MNARSNYRLAVTTNTSREPFSPASSYILASGGRILECYARVLYFVTRCHTKEFLDQFDDVVSKRIAADQELEGNARVWISTLYGRQWVTEKRSTRIRRQPANQVRQ